MTKRAKSSNNQTMLLVVKDACLLIDLVEVGLLETWFQLGIPTHTTDLVLAEVKSYRQQITAFVHGKTLQEHSLDATALQETVNFSRANGISLPDASAVVLAKQLSAMLLTGDRKLRRAAELHQIETHGILWILDHMVNHGALRPKLAAQQLESLLKRGSRYPKHECEERIQKWQNA